MSELALRVPEFSDLLAQGWEVLVGTALGGDDLFEGSDLGDRLYGWGGNDTFAGALESNFYYNSNESNRVIERAGEGTDTVFASADYKLGANLERLRLIRTENIDGRGNSGDNRVIGSDVDNVLDGSRGTDGLTGGAGADGFVFDFNLGASNGDRIADFTSGEDTIVLDQTTFRKLDLGELDASRFKDIGLPGTKVDSDDRVIYNSDHGYFYYNKDGPGGADCVKVAILTSEAVITAADFLIV